MPGSLGLVSFLLSLWETGNPDGPLDLDFEPPPLQNRAQGLGRLAPTLPAASQMRFQELGPVRWAWFQELGFWLVSFSHMAAGVVSKAGGYVINCQAAFHAQR